MLTVTLFKRRGDPTAENFRISQGNRGEPLGEWDYLTIDKRLKALGVIFTVVDYLDVKTLSNGFADKVKLPVYINLHYGTDYRTSVAYPENSPLEAAIIRQWIMTAVKKLAPEKLSVADDTVVSHDVATPALSVVQQANVEVVASSPKADVKPSATATDSTKTEEAVLKETASSFFNLGLGIGGTLLVAALAIAGVAVGSLAADNFNKDEEDGNLASGVPDGEDEYPLYIESITGGKMDFTKIWEERAPTMIKKAIKTQPSKVDKSKGKEEVSTDRAMEIPVPANIQHQQSPIKDTPFDSHEDE